jgi:hypothetical protein
MFSIRKDSRILQAEIIYNDFLLVSLKILQIKKNKEWL